MKTLMKRVVAITTAAALLAGCASQAANDALLLSKRHYLDTLEACEIAHNQDACQAIPAATVDMDHAQAVVDHETDRNGRIAAAAILIPLLVLGAAAGAAHGPPGPPPGFHPPPPPLP
jgi:hypothetical protein